ncbi:programmed cell death protein 2 [Pelagophyceae sp. CCMP2097]|nr:programmed cell death protein 2 [Pelagophyceae sp. CCMP2097]
MSVSLGVVDLQTAQRSDSWLGGSPKWLGGLPPPTPACAACGDALAFVAQIGAPVYGPRALHIFGCRRGCAAAGCWRALRSQPRAAAPVARAAAPAAVLAAAAAAPPPKAPAAAAGWDWGADDDDGDLDDLEALLQTHELGGGGGAFIPAAPPRRDPASPATPVPPPPPDEAAAPTAEPTAPVEPAFARVEVFWTAAAASKRAAIDGASDDDDSDYDGGASDDDDDARTRARAYLEGDAELEGATRDLIEQSLVAARAAPGGPGAAGGGGGGAGEAYERPPPTTRAALRFAAVLRRSPHQVVRYAYGAAPLWPAAAAPAAAGKCACGTRRVFEVQLVPQAIYYLGASAMDWGTVAVWSCEDSCDVAGEELVVVAPGAGA